MGEKTETELRMQHVMDVLVKALPGCAICLMIAPFGAEPGRRVNYIGNGDRADMLAMMKEVVARWEGRRHKGSERVQ